MNPRLEAEPFGAVVSGEYEMPPPLAGSLAADPKGPPDVHPAVASHEGFLDGFGLPGPQAATTPVELGFGAKDLLESDEGVSDHGGSDRTRASTTHVVNRAFC